MTTICYDKRIGVMAGDRLACVNDNKHGRTTKVFKIDGHLIGISGASDVAVAILRWFDGGRKDEDWPEMQQENSDCGVLVVDPDNVVMMYGRYPIPIVMDQEIHAIGSGGDFALAALALGCTPAKAVEVASALDCYTGGGIDVVSLGDADQ